MSNNNNNKIVFASILGAILATGLLALNPSMVGAQLYANEYGYDDSNYNNYDRQSKSSHVDIQKIKCFNSNININGIDITQIPQDSSALAATNEGAGATADASNSENGNGLDKINLDKNLVNICVNVNVNEQVKVTPPPEEEEPSPCENCFSDLTQTQKDELLSIVDATSLGAYCDRLLSTPNSCDETDSVFFALEEVTGLDGLQIADIIECLADEDIGVINFICV
ncbi:MAG: hypothetical protein WCB31_07450 [Nitrososphaeraceae archaeon]